MPEREGLQASDEVVFRADPRDRIEIPQESGLPLLLAPILTLCIVAGVVGWRSWHAHEVAHAAAALAQAPVKATVHATAPAPLHARRKAGG